MFKDSHKQRSSGSKQNVQTAPSRKRLNDLTASTGVMCVCVMSVCNVYVCNVCVCVCVCVVCCVFVMCVWCMMYVCNVCVCVCVCVCCVFVMCVWCMMYVCNACISVCVWCVWCMCVRPQVRWGAPTDAGWWVCDVCVWCVCVMCVYLHRSVLLNGEPLQMLDDESLPELRPRTLRAGRTIAMPPTSIGFYVIKNINAYACRRWYTHIRTHLST